MNDDNPTEKRLIEKYDKYPDYLKITFKKPDTFYDYLVPFNSSNREAITKILNPKSKEAICNLAFPVTMYI